MTPRDLRKESQRATQALAGKTVSRVDRHAEREVAIQFADGTRLFVDSPSTALELSITGPDAGGQFAPIIGQRVRHRETAEVGIVVWVWHDSHGDPDVYVAFFGQAFPSGAPESKPYVLRYSPASLEPIE